MDTPPLIQVELTLECPDGATADAAAQRLAGEVSEVGPVPICTDGLGMPPAGTLDQEAARWRRETYGIQYEPENHRDPQRDGGRITYRFTLPEWPGDAIVRFLSREYPGTLAHLHALDEDAGQVCMGTAYDGRLLMTYVSRYGRTRPDDAEEGSRELIGQEAIRAVNMLRARTWDGLSRMVTFGELGRAALHGARLRMSEKAAEFEDWAVRAEGPEPARSAFLAEARALHEHPEEMVVDSEGEADVAWVLIRRRDDEAVATTGGSGQRGELFHMTPIHRNYDTPLGEEIVRGDGLMRTVLAPPRVRQPFDLTAISSRHPDLRLTRFYVSKAPSEPFCVGIEVYADGRIIDQDWRAMDPQGVIGYSTVDARAWLSAKGMPAMRFLVSPGSPLGDYQEGEPT